jgi:spore maturation protein CgeB
MRAQMRLLAADADARRAFAESGRATVLARHTCAHRADELIGIARSLGLRRPRILEGAIPA